MPDREWSESYAAARAEARRLAEWTAQLRAETGRTVERSRRLRERLRRERYGSRSGRGAGELREDRPVGTQTDPGRLSDAKR